MYLCLCACIYIYMYVSVCKMEYHEVKQALPEYLVIYCLAGFKLLCSFCVVMVLVL